MALTDIAHEGDTLLLGGRTIPAPASARRLAFCGRRFPMRWCARAICDWPISTLPRLTRCSAKCAPKRMAWSTPAPVGTMISSMSSFSAKRAACKGAAPPNAIIARAAISLPHSTAWTRAAAAMFSSTISQTPKAASAVSMPAACPTFSVTASVARGADRLTRPPAKRAGSILPNTRSASVTVGAAPPRSCRPVPDRRRRWPARR